MSLHSELFASAGVDALFSTQGETISITPPDGEAVSLTALVSGEEQRTKPAPNGTRQVFEREVSVTRNPDGPYGGLDVVQLRAKVTIGGRDYSLSEVISDTPYIAKFRVERSAAEEISRRDYRGKR